MMSKKRKLDAECRVFNDQWSIRYFFVQNTDKCICLICNEAVSVFKEYNLKRHYNTKHGAKYDQFQENLRKKKLEELTQNVKKQQKNIILFSNKNLSTIQASFRACQIIAEEGKPFTDGDFAKRICLALAEEICPDKVKDFMAVSLSASTVVRRIEDIGADVRNKLEEKVLDFTNFSIALDESEDVSHTAQLLIYIRGINKKFEVTEELAGLKSLKDRTTGENIFSCVSETINDLKLNWNLLSAVTTDGAKNMIGFKIGFMGRLHEYLEKEGIKKPMHFHCIIHQQALCGKFLGADSVMSVIISTVNFIRKTGLNHRQFKSFLEMIEAEYGDLLYHTEVRWLSRGKVLKRFFELRTEIDIFMFEKLKPVPELSNSKWLWRLAFLTDITDHLNVLNKKLQGRDKLVNHLYYDIVSFETKLDLFKNHIIQYKFTHFSCCDSLSKTLPKNIFPLEDCINNIEILRKSFADRFIDFKEQSKVFKLFQNPIEIPINEVDDDFQLELIDLQANDELKAIFKNENLISFYDKLEDSYYPILKNNARKIISIFGSTYLCEQTFSKLKYIKSKNRSRLTDLHLENYLQIGLSKLKPNLKKK
jgi:hypothetical protein